MQIEPRKKPAAPADVDGPARPKADSQHAHSNDNPSARTIPAAADDVKHAVTRDQADQSKAKPGTAEYLRHAQQKSGRGPMDLVMEFYRLSRGPGKLTLPEYVQYGVYDKTRYSPQDQARFLTNTLHWPITHVCCDMTWQATTEDKWLSYRLLEGSGIRIPETLAVIDTTDRSYPGTRKISTAAELRDFITSQNVLPIFGKENRGICSFGAFVVVDANKDAMHLKGVGWVDYAACLYKFVGGTPYLLQRLETNHQFFNRYTVSLATVRVCILMAEDGVKIPFAVLKVPARENVADSFWRPGNLACKVELDTGKIQTVRSKNSFGTTDYVAHPETGEQLLGETVPMWDRILDLARACAPIFRPVRYQSMDIAITDNGPVLIEINTGGGFDLPQLATGEGFLTDDVRAFFRNCGYKKL